MRTKKFHLYNNIFFSDIVSKIGVPMRFSYTHHMPYTGMIAGQDWPVSNKQFDPKKGAKLFNHYLEDKIA